MLRMWLLLLIAAIANCATDSDYPYPITPVALSITPCSVYCRYQPRGNGFLTPMCINPGIGNNIGECTDCDELLFRKVPSGTGFLCIDHQYNG